MKKYLNNSIPGLLLVCFCLLLQACNPTMQAYKNGVKRFDNGEYDLALKDFQKAVEGDYEPAQSNYLIAESYRLSNRYQEAIPYYKKAMEAGATDPNARFQYAYALKASGQYDEAPTGICEVHRKRNCRQNPERAGRPRGRDAENHRPHQAETGGSDGAGYALQHARRGVFANGAGQ